MAKPRTIGSNAAYIPNSRADMRNKKLYQRGREYTDKHEVIMQEIRERREMKQLERMKTKDRPKPGAAT
jgi:hypothetical protein